MIDSLSNISPTVTLAELFESQCHYVAAYTIYRYLNINCHKEEVAEKLKKIKEPAFSINDGNKLTALSMIFDEEEIERLGILSNTIYKHFKYVLDGLKKKETASFDAVGKEEKQYFSNFEKQSNNNWDDLLLTEPQRRTDSSSSIAVKEVDWKNINLSAFVEFLINLKNDGMNIEDHKLADIMEEFFLQNKQKYKEHNDDEI